VGGAPYTEQRRQTRTGISRDIKGTDCNPLFQTFVEGIESYRFDVPDGSYEVTLCFAEYISRTQQANLMYNFPTRDRPGGKAEARAFGVRVNGDIVMDKLNLEEDYESFRAVAFQVSVRADQGAGIQVDFQPVSSQALLSGIRLSSRQ
jgi:beta-galactosidase